MLPSRLEGLPNVVLDAMYLQTPVVVTRCVPVIDRIVNSEQGIIVDVEDVEGLASAMRNAIKSPFQNLIFGFYERNLKIVLKIDRYAYNTSNNI